jgi:type I restriction enzyme M protein
MLGILLIQLKQLTNMKVEIKGNKIFAPLKNGWVTNTAEEKLKQEFIARLVNSYGYLPEQLAQDVEIKKRYIADIAIWRSEKDKLKSAIPSIIITVECKAEHIKIKESDYSIGYNFASTINANFFIAVNLKEAKVFHIQKDNAPKKVEKLSDIPKAEILSDDRRIDKYIKDTKSFTREEFTKLLTRCHNIIRNNDKLSPEAAFDEISKVLFMKIMYERNAKEEMIFSKAKFQSDEKHYEQIIRPNLKKDVALYDQDYMQYLFDNTKREFETDGIFEPRDQIKIKRNSFEMIVEELEAFNLSDTSDDVKGIAFEQFLGKTFRGELGQFFTPRTIVDFMVDILDPQEGETICDPCCGSGGFLITAFEHIRNQIDLEIKNEIIKIKADYFDSTFETSTPKRQKEIDKKVQGLITKLNAEFDVKNPKSRYYHLSHNCVFGTDANPRMARTAKMNMIMHGDGHNGVHHNDGLLNVNGIFDNRFDVILTNPPFGSRVEKSLKITEADRFTDPTRIKKYKKLYGAQYDDALKQVNDNVGKSLLSLYEVGSLSSLTEVLFLERCINLLKPGGRMGIVLPEGVLNNTNLQKIRDYIEGRAKILLITSIPQDVFIASGATVKPSLLFFKKFTDEERNQWETLETVIRKEVLTTHQLDVIPDAKTISKKIEEELYSEIKNKIKTAFNYEIPIAQIEKAGISSTGSAIENELNPLAAEYKIYRKTNKLWKTDNNRIKYLITNDEIKRSSDMAGINGQSDIFYGK